MGQSVEAAEVLPRLEIRKGMAVLNSEVDSCGRLADNGKGGKLYF